MPSTAAINPENSGSTSSSARTRAADVRSAVNNIGHAIKSVDINRIEKLSFYIDDIPYHVTHKKESTNTEASRVCIQAILGYLPYSVDANEKRQALLAVLDSTHRLEHVRFGLDHQGRIFVAGNLTTDTLAAPDFIFFPLSRFLQEAQPFIDLIGQYL